MRRMLLLSCLGTFAVLASPGVPADDAPAKTPVQLVFDLSDGSRVVGTPAVDQLKITTQYADLQIPFSGVRTIELGKDHTAGLTLQNGDRVTGKLAATEIAVKAIFGDVTIPLAEVRTIRVRQSGAQAMPDGLVLHYTFDEDEGGKVTDASGTGNDGTVHGATYTKDGKIGGGMSFNGRSEAVVVGNPSNLRLQDFTIMAWIKRGSAEKVSETAQDGQIFGYGQNGYIMGLHSDGKLFISKVGVGGVFSSCTIQDTGFHHVALVKKGARITFYLDGTACPADDYNDTFEFNTDAAVGARADSLDGSFLGVIDEVAVFSRPLTDNEIKAVYDSQK